jgi:hypothetical protein
MKDGLQGLREKSALKFFGDLDRGDQSGVCHSPTLSCAQITMSGPFCICAAIGKLSVIFSGGFRFAFEVHNSRRDKQLFTIRAELGEPAKLEPLIPRLGPSFHLPSSKGEVEELGFVPSASPGKEEMKSSKQEIEVELAGSGRTGFSLV